MATLLSSVGKGFAYLPSEQNVVALKRNDEYALVIKAVAAGHEPRRLTMQVERSKAL